MAQRVRVVGSAVVAGGAAAGDRLTTLLEEWAAWCRRCRFQPSARSGGVVSSMATSKSFDDMCHEMDDRVSQTIDAAVDDLLPAQRAALYRRYELAAVFRFPRDNYRDQLDQAYTALRQRLPRRGVVLDI